MKFSEFIFRCFISLKDERIRELELGGSDHWKVSYHRVRSKCERRITAKICRVRDNSEALPAY